MARDVSRIIDVLSARPEVDLSRIGVAGISMGSSTCMVLAWKEPRPSLLQRTPLGHGAQLVAHKGIAAGQGAKAMGVAAAVALDVELALQPLQPLQPLQQRLHRGIVGFAPPRVEGVGDLANGRRPLVPQELQDAQFRFGHVE
jgi:dienelactone hydrolase